MISMKLVDEIRQIVHDDAAAAAVEALVTKQLEMMQLKLEEKERQVPALALRVVSLDLMVTDLREQLHCLQQQDDVHSQRQQHQQQQQQQQHSSPHDEDEAVRKEMEGLQEEANKIMEMLQLERLQSDKTPIQHAIIMNNADDDDADDDDEHAHDNNNDNNKVVNDNSHDLVEFEKVLKSEEAAKSQSLEQAEEEMKALESKLMHQFTANRGLESTELFQSAKIAGLQAQLQVLERGVAHVEKTGEQSQKNEQLLNDRLNALMERKKIAEKESAGSFQRLQDLQRQIKTLQSSQLGSKDRQRKVNEMLGRLNERIGVLQKQKLAADLQTKKKEEEIVRLKELEKVLQMQQLGVRDKQKAMAQEAERLNELLTRLQTQQLEAKDKVLQTAAKLSEQQRLVENYQKQVAASSS